MAPWVPEADHLTRDQVLFVDHSTHHIPTDDLPAHTAGAHPGAGGYGVALIAEDHETVSTASTTPIQLQLGRSSHVRPACFPALTFSTLPIMTLDRRYLTATRSISSRPVAQDASGSGSH
jgi:hypothetical protein